MPVTSRATAVMRRRALARSGKAPTERMRRFTSPWRRSRPLVLRSRFQWAFGKEKKQVAAAKPSRRHSMASGTWRPSPAWSASRRFLASWSEGASKMGRRVLAGPSTQPPGGLGEDVPGEVHRATLELGLGQGLACGGRQARVPVGDDEPHAPQPSLQQLAQQLQPRLR